MSMHKAIFSYLRLSHKPNAMIRSVMISLYFLSMVAAALSAQTGTAYHGKQIFINGRDGYHTYRIPSIAVTTKGTVLAVCEGRKNSSGDSGDIDLLLKRSEDRGKTWSRQEIIWDDGDNTCGNPCMVVDKQTGIIWLLSTWNKGDDHESEIIDQTSTDTRRVYVFYSGDDGLTWSEPLEITAEVKRPDWTWYATGPGSGIQLNYGPYKNRLVIPCDHIEAGTKHYYSHIIYSDDHGKTWQLGGRTPEHQVNECQAVELTGGRIMLNMRNYDPSMRYRQTAISDDGGITWYDQKFDTTLIEPICQAAIERYDKPGKKDDAIIIFSNPASRDSRMNMTLRASKDEGKTWPVPKLIHPGPSAYSDMAVMDNGNIAIFYEAGTENPYESIIFTQIQIESIKND